MPANFLDSGAGSKMHPTPSGSRGIGGIRAVEYAVECVGYAGHEVTGRSVDS